jgi:tripartite-type tricarboxylate transporter receptor subunit TctC
MYRILILGLVSLCLLAGQARAQTDYPNHPVRIIVPSAPGGGTDTVARELAQLLAKSMGQPFIIDNRPGAGNMIGIEAAARSAPDGYTLLMVASTLTILPVIHKKMPYDAARDFAPISQVVTLPQVLVVNSSAPVHSLADLIALAKKKPGQLNYASAGPGTAPHMAMELLKSMAGIDLQHVPYKGVAPALTDVIGGRMAGMIVNVLSAQPHIESGALRALAVTSRRRAETMPNIPTIAEFGFPDYEAPQWFGLLAPAGTPAPIVARLQLEVANALKTPEMKQRLIVEGAEAVGNTPADFSAAISAELAKWAAVARAANIQPQ